MTVPVAEVMVLETWHMAELEPQIAVAELEHATTPAEVTEVPRFEAWGMSELECGTAVAEVARLESPRLSKDTPAVELEALVSQVQLRPGVSRKMPKPKSRSRASVGCDTIPNAARTAASSIILRIAVLLIGRAAQPPACLMGCSASLSHANLISLIGVGWSVGQALVHLRPAAVGIARGGRLPVVFGFEQRRSLCLAGAGRFACVLAGTGARPVMFRGK